MNAVHVLRGMYGLWVREATVYVREYSRIISSLVSPVIWLGIVGTGFNRYFDVPYEDVTYREFLFPGVLGMTVLFITVFYGLYIVWDRKMDVLKAVLVAPQPRWSLFAGKILGGTTEGLFQALLILVVAWPLVHYSPVVVPAVIVYVVLIGVSLTALGLALGSYFESYQAFQITSSFIVFPMFFLSGALYPTTGLPPWLYYIHRANPLTYGVDALRGLLVGPEALEFGYVLDGAVLVVFSAVMIVVGAFAFERIK